MNKKKTLTLAALALVVSAGGGLVAVTHADTVAATTTTSAVQTGTSAVVDVPDTQEETGRHAPAGGDGVISSISGNTIVMSEEGDEGNASYIIDASGATISKGGTIVALSNLAVGDKIFVKGTVSGTNIAATSIESGHGHQGAHDESDAPEAPGTPETNDDGAAGEY